MKWFPYFGVHGDASVVTDTERPAFTTVATVSPSPDDYGKSNCHLMASAPELLEACRAAFDAIMKHCAQTGDVIWIDPPHQFGFVHESVCERLRNVIAQAEGRAVEEIEG